MRERVREKDRQSERGRGRKFAIVSPLRRTWGRERGRERETERERDREREREIKIKIERRKTKEERRRVV